MIWRVVGIAVFVVSFGLAGVSRPPLAVAKPVEYVKICDVLGAGWVYIPGITNTCMNLDTGVTENTTTLAVGQTALAKRVQELEDRFNTAFEGSAIGMAMPTPVIERDQNFALAGNWAQFDGANALAVAGAVRVNNNLSFSGGVGLGLAQGNVGTKVGFNLSW